MMAYLKRRVTNWTREELLLETNEIQKLIYAQSNKQIRVVDPTTGLPPFLATTATVHDYDCPADCRRTIAIFTRDFVGSNRQNSNDGYNRYRYGQLFYFNQPITARDRTPGTVATVTFTNDPGTTTDVFFHFYEAAPPELTSESIPLFLPEKHHLKLIDGVLARVRSEKFGAESEWFNWEYNILPKIIVDMNQGDGGNIGHTQTRMEYQYYFDDYVRTRNNR